MEHEIGHVLFMDIVGYSRLPDAEQARLFRRLQEMVANCPSVIGAQDRVVRTPTGDGMALSFFDDASRPLRCAQELTEQIAKDSPFEIRMGINSGPVVRQIDINRNTNVSGDGINTAQRVMDFGDAGHVLLSQDFARALREQAADAHDIGTATAKHGKRVRLFNFYNETVGNPAIPLKVRKELAWARPPDLRLGLTSRNIVVAALQILGWILARPRNWREHVAQIDPDLPPNFSVVELTRTQLRANPELRQLVLQAYTISPLVLIVLTLVVAAAAGVGAHVNLWYTAGLTCGFAILTIVLGAAPGILFVAFEAALAILSASPVTKLVFAAAAAVWLSVVLPALSPIAVRRSMVREVSAAIGGLAGALLVMGIVAVPLWGYFYSSKSGVAEHVFDVLTFAVMAFVALNGAFVVRWGRWSRGFATGQIAGAVIALGYGFVAGFTNKQLASRAADLAWSAREAFPAGLSVSMNDAIAMAFAFAVAEKMAGARAAVLAALLMIAADVLVEPSVNVAPAMRLLPLISVVGGYVMSRRKR